MVVGDSFHPLLRLIYCQLSDGDSAWGFIMMAWMKCRIVKSESVVTMIDRFRQNLLLPLCNKFIIHLRHIAFVSQILTRPLHSILQYMQDQLILSNVQLFSCRSPTSKTSLTKSTFRGGLLVVFMVFLLSIVRLAPTNL